MKKPSLFKKAIQAIAQSLLPTLSPVWSGFGGWWPVLHEANPGDFQRDIETKPDTVLAYHAVYACVTLIAADIGKLRPKLMQRDKDGIWVEYDSASPFWQVLRKPNDYQNHIQFKEWWITSKLTRGNAYALKERDARGIVTRLYLLDPCKVLPLVTNTGDIFYRLGTDNLSGITETDVVVPASEIIHDRMNCLFHPLVGIPPIYACCVPAWQGIKIQNNSLSFFGNNSQPSGILVVPGPLNDDEALKIKAAWQNNYSGTSRGKIAVLADGLTFQPIATNAQDAQLIEQLKWTVEAICSTFHVPPFKIGIGQMPTYQNGELLNQVYYSDCLQSLIESMEECLDQGLGLDSPKEGKTIGVELDLMGLLRMDTSNAVKTFSEGVRGGIMAPNEARRKLDLVPTPGGDSVYMQQQNWPLEKLEQRTLEQPMPVAPPPALPAPEEETEEAREFYETLIKGLAGVQQA